MGSQVPLPTWYAYMRLAQQMDLSDCKKEEYDNKSPQTGGIQGWGGHSAGCAGGESSSFPNLLACGQWEGGGGEVAVRLS